MFGQRKGTKKSSMFKIQAQKDVFLEYLDNIQKCPAILKFPQMSHSLINQTSETVYTYCYTFRDDSPFLRGINYDNKNIGFSHSDNIVSYRQWLPNISQAFLLGQFNNFDQNSHELGIVPGEKDWYGIEIDTNVTMISEGSLISLRIIDVEGKEQIIVPPSCKARKGNQGAYIRFQKCPFERNTTKIHEIIGYYINLNQIGLQNIINFIHQNKKCLQHFNAIILTNVFNDSQGLFYRYTLEYQFLCDLAEKVQLITEELGVKVILEWKCDNGKEDKLQDVIKKQMLKQNQNKQIEFNFEKEEVFAYYLSYLSFYLKYLNIGGYQFTNIDQIAKSTQGYALIKCISVMKDRLSQNSLTIATTSTPLHALTYPILDGGLGIMFSYQYSSKIQPTKQIKNICQKLEQQKNYSNCVLFQLPEQQAGNDLSLITSTFYSERGIICEGKLPQNTQKLIKILKLRGQSQFFIQKSQINLQSQDIIQIRRGKSIILININNEQIVYKFPQINKLEYIFNSGDDQPQIQQSSITIKGNSCLLFEQRDYQ